MRPGPSLVFPVHLAEGKGGGADPEQICVIVDEPTRQGSAVGAAMEERNVPFRLAGPAALFRRPEVRDAVAWLRVLADPDDSAAAARAMTRPPVELRSVDLARLTTIARRRKLDMVSAAEAALESPQVPPDARERLQGFLKLYRAASAVLDTSCSEACGRFFDSQLRHCESACALLYTRRISVCWQLASRWWWTPTTPASASACHNCAAT